MGVKFKPFAASGNQNSVTEFTDQFNRANLASLGGQWVALALKASVGAGNLITGSGTILTNAAKFVGTGPVTPAQDLPVMWTPRVLMDSLYSAARVYVEVEYTSQGGGFVGGLCVRANMEAVGAVTTPPYYDYYYLQFDGLIAKVIGGAAPVGFGGTGMAPVAGDIVRLEAETSGNTTILRQKLNGVLLDTEVQDGAGVEISQVGYNGIIFQSGSGTPINDFFTLNRVTVGIF